MKSATCLPPSCILHESCSQFVSIHCTICNRRKNNEFPPWTAFCRRRRCHGRRGRRFRRRSRHLNPAAVAVALLPSCCRRGPFGVWALATASLATVTKGNAMPRPFRLSFGLSSFIHCIVTRVETLLLCAHAHPLIH